MLARDYFLTEVAGQARATIEAKRRDLSQFLSFCQQRYGRDRPVELMEGFIKFGGKLMEMPAVFPTHGTLKHRAHKELFFAHL